MAGVTEGYPPGGIRPFVLPIGRMPGSCIEARTERMFGRDTPGLGGGRIPEAPADESQDDGHQESGNARDDKKRASCVTRTGYAFDGEETSKCCQEGSSKPDQYAGCQHQARGCGFLDLLHRTCIRRWSPGVTKAAAANDASGANA